jgi:hypothetical protein
MIVNSWTVLVNMFFVVFAQMALANKVGSWKYKKTPGRGVTPCRVLFLGNTESFWKRKICYYKKNEAAVILQPRLMKFLMILQLGPVPAGSPW